MVSVICCTIRDEMMDNVFQNYEKQDIKKELIVILNRQEMDLVKWTDRAKCSKKVSVYQLPQETTLGECLNFGIQLSKYDLIAKMDDDDYYGPLYLSEQIKALKYKKADVVCKRTVYIYFELEHTLAIHLGHRAVNVFLEKEGGVKGATLVFTKSLCDKIDFPHVNINEDMSFLRKCLKNKVKVYVTDKNNYVCLRKYESLHTWKVSNQQLMKESMIIGEIEDYKSHVRRSQRHDREDGSDGRAPGQRR